MTAAELLYWSCSFLKRFPSKAKAIRPLILVKQKSPHETQKRYLYIKLSLRNIVNEKVILENILILLLSIISRLFHSTRQFIQHHDLS